MIEVVGMLGNCFVMSRCVCWIGCGWSWPAQSALEVQTCRELRGSLVLIAVCSSSRIPRSCADEEKMI